MFFVFSIVLSNDMKTSSFSLFSSTTSGCSSVNVVSGSFLSTFAGPEYGGGAIIDATDDAIERAANVEKPRFSNLKSFY